MKCLPLRNHAILRAFPKQDSWRAGQHSTEATSFKHLRVSPSRHAILNNSNDKTNQVWSKQSFHSKIYYFYYKFFSYIQPNTNLVTSNKSNTRCIAIACLCLTFFEKNGYIFRHNIHDDIEEMTPKQATHHFQEGNDTKNSQKNTLYRAADWSLQDSNDITSKPPVSKMKSELKKRRRFFSQRSQGIPHASLHFLPQGKNSHGQSNIIQQE